MYLVARCNFFNQGADKSTADKVKIERPKWEHEKIKKVVVEELSTKYLDWKNVTEDELSIKDVSGYGGNSTYCISRKIADNVVAQIAFHVVGEKSSFKNQPDLLNVQKSATDIFALQGLCPNRLTEKEDQFFINQWLKKSKEVGDENLDVNLAEKLGCLLAKIHSIPLKWYDSHYEKLLENYPSLIDVPKASSFWYLTARNWKLMFDIPCSMDEWMNRLLTEHKLYADFEIYPTSPAGLAVVTTHGDFHSGNIIRSDDGVFNVIDFEQTHVSLAIQDLSYFFFAMPPTPTSRLEVKLAFCRGYLKARGYPHNEEDVFALALDTELCTLSTGFMSPLFQDFVQTSKLSEEKQARFRLVKLFVNSISNYEQLEKDNLEKSKMNRLF